MLNKRLVSIFDLQAEMTASEKGKDSGTINVSYESAEPALAEGIVNQLTLVYVNRNVNRNSAEAKISLEFLQLQLSLVRQQLESAGQKFNRYQVEQQFIDISLDTQGISN